MGCKFNFITRKNPLDLYNWAVSRASTYNVSYTGSAQEGFFSFHLLGGQVKGNYKIVGQKIIITISKKPLILPCIIIENFLKTHIT